MHINHYIGTWRREYVRALFTVLILGLAIFSFDWIIQSPRIAQAGICICTECYHGGPFGGSYWRNPPDCEGACGGCPDGPEIISFAANPNMIFRNSTTTLSWEVRDNQDNQPTCFGVCRSGDCTNWSNHVASVPTGTRIVAPIETTTYGLQCMLNNIAATRDTTVIVCPPAPHPQPTHQPGVNNFISSQDTISIGETVTLSWVMRDKGSCRGSCVSGDCLDWGPRPPRTLYKSVGGTHAQPHVQVVSPDVTSTYYLRCHGGLFGWWTTTRRVTVHVCPAAPIPPPPPPPVIVSFNAEPDVITQGHAVRLSWDSEHARSCTASCDYGDCGAWPTGKEPDGYVDIQLNTVSTSTFRLTCENVSGSVYATDSVRVVLFPRIEYFTGAPTPIHPRQRVRLDWRTENTNRCWAVCEPQYDGNCEEWEDPPDDANEYKELTGHQFVSPSRTTTYRLICNNLAGRRAEATVTINVFRLWWREVVPVFPFIEEMLGLVLPPRPVENR